MTASSSDFREPHLREGDFLGAFAVIESAQGILLVQNRRHIGGREVLVWDLPGGQVESHESLREALVRELQEELCIQAPGEPEFLFYQEGEKLEAGRRCYLWRSFFFAVESYEGRPQAAREVLDVRWAGREEMAGLLHAPYHESFLTWLEQGGRSFSCRWCE